MENIVAKVCLTPFEELHQGDENIYDWVEEGYTVPAKVIAYLKTTEPDVMCPGIICIMTTSLPD